MAKLDKQKTIICPKCGSDWDGGCIFETLIAQDRWKEYKDPITGKLRLPTEEAFREDIKNYYSPPYRWSRIIGIEDPRVYDGVSWWKCPDCGAMWDRWTGEESDGPEPWEDE